MDNNETRAILEEEIAKLEKFEDETSDETVLPPEPAAVMIENQDKFANDNYEEDEENAPKSFDKKLAEDFKKLPPEIKKQLWEHEKKHEESLTKLDNQLQQQKWLDEVIEEQSSRLESLGIKSPEDYVKNLIKFDTLLEKNPQETLQFLAEIYGVNLNIKTNTDLQKSLPKDFENTSQKSRLGIAEKSLTAQQAIDGTTAVIREIRMQKAWDEVGRFMAATDEEGKSLHPFVDDVKPQMLALLEKRAASTLEDAYQKALWLTPTTREQLIHKKAQDMLRQRVAEAEKAKAASFAPHGKLSKSDMSSLSTRELLMKLIDE